MDDKQTAKEQVVQVTRMQVNDAESEGTRHGQRYGKDMARQPDERTVGKGADG
jgi:hypothetical protein